ncbi:hypothetical protein W02_34230 [Nitrospira sp. KM1]|uniref:GNAT family N-acetyltransferase n=1 Tax=Nitrospira sp. KM1 TaxID=1936990 RepID=UPI0013A79885|nr:GNAT family N-acetyltransferase [Nitrospira sp. KM1]BCA56283.1 hypothetical protein W02_34230 [Nitrospira sp. KM1]
MFAQAQLADLDTVWGVIERCRADLKKRGIFRWGHIYPTRDLVAQDIQNGKLYAMIVSARVIAVVTVDTAGEEQYKTVEWKTAEPALIVHRLCVEPTLQGRGFGSRMMEYVERYAVRHRCLAGC